MTAPDQWLRHATGYIGDWLGCQMRVSDLPGSVLVVARHGKLAHERAYGVADIETGEALTPRRRFRVASHSKTLTEPRHDKIGRYLRFPDARYY